MMSGFRHGYLTSERTKRLCCDVHGILYRKNFSAMQCKQQIASCHAGFFLQQHHATAMCGPA